MATQPKPNKVVKISENELVTLIDNIVKDAVTLKKKEWIAENAKVAAEKDQLLESRIAKLESLLKTKATDVSKTSVVKQPAITAK